MKPVHSAQPRRRWKTASAKSAARIWEVGQGARRVVHKVRRGRDKIDEDGYCTACGFRREPPCGIASSALSRRCSRALPTEASGIIGTKTFSP